MTTTTDTAFRLFAEGFLADDGHEYPDRVTFVADDLPNADEVIWRSLSERRPVVIVTGEGVELLVAPRDRSGLLRWFDGLRGRTSVTVSMRLHDAAPRYAVPARLGHRPLEDMRREPALCV